MVGRTVSRRVESVAMVMTSSQLMWRPSETTPTSVESGSVTGEVGGERRR